MKNSIICASLSSAMFPTAIAALSGSQQQPICADPSLSTIYSQMFSPLRTAHVLNPKVNFLAVYDSNVGTSDNFQWQGEAFRAWTTPQNSTVPIYQLGTDDGNIKDSNFVYLPAVNGSPPTPPPGFNPGGIVGYAYATQICGSVPLYAAANAANSDHYWTTNLKEHNSLISSAGWVDNGIPFYVLPLDTCSCSPSPYPYSQA